MTKSALIKGISSLFFAFLLAFFLAMAFKPTAALASPLNTSLFGPSTLYSGLVGWWTFDGANLVNNATDSSGNGKNGDLIGYTSTTSVQGKIGQALAFDGAANSISVPSISNVQSVSFWVKPNSTAQSITDFNGTQTVDISGGTLRGNSFASPTRYVDGIQTATFPDTKWHFVTITTATPFNASAMTIGKISSAFFGGYLDDVRLYSRALSQQEVTELYNSGSAVRNNTTQAGPGNLNADLIAWWTFDGAKMTANVADSSTSGNNANLFGGATTSVQGRMGQGLKTTSTKYVNGPNNSSTQFSGPFSVSIWVNSTSLSSAITTDFMDKEGYPNVGWSLLDDVVAGNSVKFALWPAAGVSISCGTGVACLARTLVNDGKWHLVTGVYDGGHVAIYLDGVLKDNQLSGTFTPDTSDPITIGRGAVASFDDARIYNRALSQAEITQLYNSSGGGKQNTSVIGPGNLNYGLVGWWTFDGKDTDWGLGQTSDKSGQGNNGSLIGMSTTTSPVQGKVGQALKFDGTSSYVPTANIAATNGAGALTLSAWIKQDSLVQASSFVSKFLPAGHHWSFFSGDAGDATEMACEAGNNSVAYSPSGAHAAGVWEHWVCVFDGSQADNATRLKLYKNGVLQSASYVGTVSATLNSNSAFVTIGADPTPASYWNGSIDDVRIYSRALTASEVLRLYNMNR